MNTLRIKLQKLHKEKSVWQEKEQQYQTNTDNLQAEIAKLRKALTDSERMRGEMHAQLDEVIKELNLLKSRASGEKESQTFKEFVKVKRELAIVMEENEKLKGQLKMKGKRGSGGGGLLPKLDSDSSSSLSKASGKKEFGWGDIGKR